MMIALGVLAAVTLIRDTGMLVNHADFGGGVPFVMPAGLAAIGLIVYRIKRYDSTGR